ncbi:TPA: hypothetical protein ACMDQE_003473 [Vibrio cholerae]|uniref:hypothetical protein n=1 Tax=Vibrio cholerae TaxID=666 RepID=UPI0018F0DCD1|nr:hypothetical protein [Vibrio cholerae]ELP1876852.1 hypothetical protein [Vibrio vulnificus]MBJ6922573.1 hypothetical protein [Vibrio cholerae]GIB64177.1 hypothetical protein VCSRO93_3696 [Vibrio cholerae]
MNLSELESSIARSRWFVSTIFGLTIGVYAVWFWIIKDQPLSADAAYWGTFGDFVGGILNPLIAFSAFYWLTISVLIQKTELEDTKKALVESSLSQQKQASISEIQQQISVYQSKLTATNIDLEAEYAYRNTIINKATGEVRGTSGHIIKVMTKDGNVVAPQEALSIVSVEIEKLLNKQRDLLTKIDELSKKI